MARFNFGNINYGVRNGLAYKHNFAQDQRNLKYNEQAELRKRADTQNRARILGDSIKFGKATNPWDNKLLKEFSGEQVKKIGKFIAENPDWNINAGKMVQFRQMTNQLIDNDIVWRSQRIDGQIEDFNKWKNQPGNREYLNDPEIVEFQEQVDNYNKTGDRNGTGEFGEEIEWVPPTAKVNLTDLAIKAGRAVQFDNHQLLGRGGIKYWVSDARVDNVAKSVLEDELNGRHWRRAWETMDQDTKKKVYPGGIHQYVRDSIEPYITKRQIKPPSAITASEIRARGAGKKGAINPFQRDVPDVLDAALNKNRNLSHIVTTSADVTRRSFDNENGTVNLDGAFIKLPTGNKGIHLTGSQLARSTGNFKYELAVPRFDNEGNPIPPTQEDLVLYREIEVEIPVSEMGQWEDNIGKDITDVHLGGITGIDELNDSDIHTEFKDLFSKQADPNDPNDLRGYLGKVWVKTTANDATMGLYNSQFSLKPKTTFEEQSSGTITHKAVSTMTASGRDIYTDDGTNWFYTDDDSPVK